jgi:hypothetical protein
MVDACTYADRKASEAPNDAANSMNLRLEIDIRLNNVQPIVGERSATKRHKAQISGNAFVLFVPFVAEDF